jgi:hypothetical protein
MRVLLPGLLLAAGLIAAIPARAAIITDVELDGENVTFGTDPLSQSTGLAGQSGLAGAILLTTDSGQTYTAWCIDLFHDVNLGGGQALNYVGLTLTGASDGNGGSLSALQAQEIAGLVDYGDGLEAGTHTVDELAGVQMAIWTVEYAGLTFTGPDAALVDEQADLALAPSLQGRVEAMVSFSGVQDLVADTSDIPEPATYGLVAAALLAFGFARRGAGSGRRPGPLEA